MNNGQRLFVALGCFLFLGFLCIPENPDLIRIGLIAFSGVCFSIVFIIEDKK